MNPKEEANKEILWVLRVLKKTIEIEGYGKICVISVNFPKLMKMYPEAPSLNNIRHIVRNQLEKKHKVLEIADTNNDKWYKSTEFILEINEKEFEKLYKKIEPPKLIRKITLKKGTVKFSMSNSMLVMGNLECPLPPYKNEFYLCETIFKRKVGIPVDWIEIFEQMTGKKDFEGGQRTVYDSVRRLNSRIRKDFNTEDKLFTWQNKTIKRNF